MTLDPFELAQLPRDAPLKIWESSRGFTCAICGAEQESYAWRVTLPGRPGVVKKACPGCAADMNWTVQ